MRAYLYTLASFHVEVWSLMSIFAMDIKVGREANLKNFPIVVHKMEGTIIIKGCMDSLGIVIEISDSL